MNNQPKINYDHQTIEEKWLELWSKANLFQGITATSTPKDKDYLLFAFAYPSGSGLHVGHVESKTALDMVARYKRMNGKDVYFPVGWDAFGLPAENFAIKSGIHPAETTKTAINTFRKQIKRLAISYDWENEIATSHPEYYKWTQWLFLQLYKKGLAYQDMGMVNWCPSCQTVLANEQVVNGLCERCDHEVEQKDLKQWYFKITKYKDELLSGLENLDWPHATKQQQRNWIGKKEGVNITYEVEGSGEKLTCFTTRPDTNFGATFIVLAPEHEFVKNLDSQEIQSYVKKASKKTELERQTEGKKKTGVFTGFYAINKLNGKKMPIWISDFVLAGYGTGAVVGVPGHDKRDFQFAQTFDLEVIRVIVGTDGDESEIVKVNQVYEAEGTSINSGFLDGLNTKEATAKITNHLEEKGFGEKVTTYKLRDWLISRQRYWGAPIPVVYDPDGKAHPVKEEHLPWTLPTDVDFKPTGESPLKSSKEFRERTEKLYGKGWTPEFDTMDTFVDSSWYYLRYCDSRNKEKFADEAKLKAWMPVDLYLIGPEHIVLHLLYSRFFTKFLRDEGYLKFDEPFSKMHHQGMILGPDGKKMSKSKGNVISPDIIVDKYGADTLRVYEMFMGPLEADKPWDDGAVAGVARFLRKINRLTREWLAGGGAEKDGDKIYPDLSHLDLARKLHQVIKKVGEDIPALKFNTAIASMMELANTWEKLSVEGGSGGDGQVISKSDLLSFIKILAPLAPFLTDELFHEVSGLKSEDKYAGVHLQSWPNYDPILIKEDVIKIAVQVNGKLRGELSIPADQIEDQSFVLEEAKTLETVQAWIQGKQLKKEIYIPGRIVSLVV